MVPRSAPKATLGASRLEVAKKGVKAFHKIEIIGATWAILGAILAPAGRQGGPNIEHLGVKVCPKSQKSADTGWCQAFQIEEAR